MQNNKIQELTDKLYREGLAKGQQEAAALRIEAEAEAAKIVSAAQTEATAIRAKAERAAEEARTNADKEIRMACRQAVNTVKQQLEEAVTARVVTGPVKEAFRDGTFVKSLLKTAVEAFNPQGSEPVALSVLLPEDMQKECGEFLKQSISQTLQNELTLQGDSAVKSGFKIGPKDGGYHLSFTEKDFEALVRNYLRPRMVELLFGTTK
ncbi:MAG: hypothetical protein IJS25_05400 [Bacteroidales bacterium]|nr:hypothetical protein [Bacteroidales bacterium]